MSYADIAPLYQGLSLPERCYTRTRFNTAPLEHVVNLIPANTGSLLEIGCSAGVFTNLLKTHYPAITITAIDIDRRKIATALKTVRGRAGISFIQADAFAYLESSEPFDVIAFVDVLYLFAPDRQDELIRLAVGKVPPGGAIIIKEISDHPGWKRHWYRIQEWLAVQVIGITQGSGIYLRSNNAYPDALRSAGLRVEGVDLNRGYLQPHYAWRGSKV
jgi:cyclopropane fatty-acyl-phospholipid synthase-like methyltransferase